MSVRGITLPALLHKTSRGRPPLCAFSPNDLTLSRSDKSTCTASIRADGSSILRRQQGQDSGSETVAAYDTWLGTRVGWRTLYGPWLAVLCPDCDMPAQLHAPTWQVPWQSQSPCLAEQVK